MYYRKYRPQTWGDLDSIHIRETLGQAILEDNWAQAYLLIGTRGSGKTTTARLIAKTVNCRKRKRGEEPCNECDSCKSIIAGSCLDVIEIDAASNTGVDDIRDLREKVKLAPAIGPYKVYIVDEVHMLSTSAFNALLKTLEEPPSQVIFVLATTDPQKLPATIVSRCLVYDFGQAKQEEIKDKLLKIAGEEKITIKDEVVAAIAAKARGSHRDAQKFLEQLTAVGAKMDLARLGGLNLQFDEDSARKILAAMQMGQKQMALGEIDRFTAGDGKIKDLIGEMISQLRDKLLSETDKSDDRDKIIILINKLIEANALIRDCPVPPLPLEMAVIEYCRNDEIKDRRGLRSLAEIEDGKTENGEQKVKNIWPEVLAAAKASNHNLTAFLRAGRPRELVNDTLIVEVFYKFHKEKLEETKNRGALEKIVSDIMGKEIKVKFELTEKKS